MGWVENLEADDEVTVEIIWPQPYVEYNISTIRQWSGAVADICRDAAKRGLDEIEFVLVGPTVLQVPILEEAMANFGVTMIHQIERVNSLNFVRFYADVAKLRELYGTSGTNVK